MPIANIYSDKVMLAMVHSIIHDVADFVAELLTTDEVQLDRKHISIRLIETTGAMMGRVEVELLAHAYERRVSHQDQIATRLRGYLEKQLALPGNVRVWLLLGQMGYSYTRLLSS